METNTTDAPNVDSTSGINTLVARVLADGKAIGQMLIIDQGIMPMEYDGEKKVKEWCGK